MYLAVYTVRTYTSRAQLKQWSSERNFSPTVPSRTLWHVNYSLLHACLGQMRPSNVACSCEVSQWRKKNLRGKTKKTFFSCKMSREIYSWKTRANFWGLISSCQGRQGKFEFYPLEAYQAIRAVDSLLSCQKWSNHIQTIDGSALIFSLHLDFRIENEFSVLENNKLALKFYTTR